MKKCFVISQIGKDHSQERRRADYVLRKLIQPALSGFDFRVQRIDQLAPTGDINVGIISHLEYADLVVADLDGLNPNVMFEMGIRQAWALPVIPLAPVGTKLPFDVAMINTIFYPSLERRQSIPVGARSKVIQAIKKQAKQYLSGEQLTSPFHDAMKRFGELCSLNAIFFAKKRTLEHLEMTVKDLLGEARKDQALRRGDKGAYKEFRLLLKRCFATLRDRTEGLRFAAEVDERLPQIKAKCVKICQKMGQLQQRGIRLVKLVEQNGISVPKAAERNYQNILKSLEGTIAASISLRRDLP